MENNVSALRIKFLIVSLIFHIFFLLFITIILYRTNRDLLYIRTNTGSSAFQYITVDDFDVENFNKGKHNIQKKSLANNGAVSKIEKGYINPAPEYPPIAAKWGWEGIVRLKLYIKNGKVDKIKVIKSSGYTILDREAVKTAKKWMFPDIVSLKTKYIDIEFKKNSNF